MMRKWLTVILLLYTCSLPALEVRVSLFSGRQLSSLSVRQLSGRYMLTHANTDVATLAAGENFLFQWEENQVKVTVGGKVIAFGDQFTLSGTGMNNSISLRTDDTPVRQYDDHLTIKAGDKGLTLVNTIDFEKYVAGVVQAEAGGSSNNLEFFKAQAMVSRTYALRLIRMNGSGFLLSDDVSNQVYKGKPSKAVIEEAVDATRGLVIVYDDTSLIDAVFHSNSGGTTLSAQDVWVSSLPYLQPVTDTFSINQRNYQWTWSMPVIQWLDYLNTQFGYPVHIDSMKMLALTFSQESRQKCFYQDIPLTRIRNDLKLKSTYFSITTDRDKVTFTGKGYGHGVGMSQEGAIRMAELGYCADEILRHYYTGINLIDMSELLEVAVTR